MPLESTAVLKTLLRRLFLDFVRSEEGGQIERAGENRKGVEKEGVLLSKGKTRVCPWQLSEQGLMIGLRGHHRIRPVLHEDAFKTVLMCVSLIKSRSLGATNRLIDKWQARLSGAVELLLVLDKSNIHGRILSLYGTNCS